MTFVKTSILNPYNREIVSFDNYDTIIDFLKDKYPTGFKTPTDISINTNIIKVEDYDTKLKDSDIIVLLERQGDPISAAAFFTWLANVAVTMAIGYALQVLFAPEVSSGSAQKNSASSVYNLNSSQNEAKAGQIIPVIYGSVRSYPSMINPPYYRYEDNKEYLYHLLCIGQGKYDIERLMIDNQDITNDEAVEYKLLNQSDFTSIESSVNSEFYNQTVSTLSNPSNLELITSKPESYATSFQSNNKKIIIYDKVGLDILDGSDFSVTNTKYNNGTFTIINISEVNGNTEVTVQEDVTTEPNYKVYKAEGAQETWFDWDSSIYGIPENHENLKVGMSFTHFYNGDTIYKIMRFGKGEWNLQVDKTIIDTRRASITPINTIAELSFRISSQRYKLRDNLKYVEVDYTYPYGLYYSKDNDYKDYDDTITIQLWADDTLIDNIELTTHTNFETEPVRKTHRIPIDGYDLEGKELYISFNKNEPISTDAAKQNKSFVHRIKELLKEEDNTNYGDISLLWVKIKATNAISSSGQTQVNGFFKRTDVDNNMKSVITDIYTNGTYGARLPNSDLDFEETPDTFVNGAFDQNYTIMDAMKLVSKAQKYTVYPVGQALLLKYDDVKEVSTALYNETNILRGSIKTQYFFKEESTNTDSIECFYRENDNWDEVSSIYPENGLFPERVDLFGVTDETTAFNLAKYMFKQELHRRKVITFKTDVQGLTCHFLDKIKISHNSLSWGNPGEVLKVEGNTITPSDDIELDVNTITFRNIDGSVSDTLTFTRDDEDIVILNLPDWVKEGTFYTVGEVNEYLVTQVKPQGDEVEIQCVNYNEDTYL